MAAEELSCIIHIIFFACACLSLYEEASIRVCVCVCVCVCVLMQVSLLQVTVFLPEGSDL